MRYRDYFNSIFSSDSDFTDVVQLKSEIIQGQIHFEGTYVVNIQTVNTPVKVEAPTQIDGVETIGLTPGNSSFTATKSGTVFLTATVISSGAVGDTIRLAFRKNGTELPQSRATLRTSSPGPNDRRQAVPQCLVNLEEGDVIELFVTNLVGTEDPTILNLTIIIKS